MNCREFEARILLPAGEQAPEADADALVHLRSCVRCAGRLADERSLSDALALLASEATEAPPHVEEALLREFRARPQLAFARALPGLPSWRWIALGAAAALTVALLLGVQSRFTRTSPPDVNATRDERTAPAAAAPAAPVHAQLQAEPPVRAKGVRPARTRAQRALSARGETRLVTDFFPLTYDLDAAHSEGGQLIRVRVPRTVLPSFGLPMNAELAGQPVEADVLLGTNGVARAIRFVR